MHGRTVASTARRLVLVLGLAVLPAAAPAQQAPKTVAGLEQTTLVIGAVESVDLERRIVVLKGDDGGTLPIAVDEGARNLEQLRIGDRVSIRYRESLVVRLHKPGSVQPSGAVALDSQRAALGEKPGGTETVRMTVVATVLAVDPSKPSVTLVGSGGKPVERIVKDARLLDGVAVGDTVELTFVSALAVSVDAAR